MQSKSQAVKYFNVVTRDVIVPNTLISDISGLQTIPQIELQGLIRCYYIDDRTTEPYSPCKNRVEGMIKIHQDKAKSKRIQRRVTKRIWDFSLVCKAGIYSLRAGKYGQTPMKILIGDTIHISKWTESGFYDFFWYWDNQNDKTEGKIGRWIGVSHRVRSALCYWVLTQK